MGRKLTDKQSAFVDHYMVCFNGVEAAKKAQYNGSYATLRVIASNNLTNANIRAEIDKRMETYAMQAQEALARLAEQARGIDSESLAVVMGSDTTEEALRLAQELGIGHLIKKIKRQKYYDKKGNENERFEIELIDTQAALFKVLQYTQEMKPQRLVIEDVRAEAIRLIKANEVDFEAMVNQFGKHDAELLFELAGVPV